MRALIFVGAVLALLVGCATPVALVVEPRDNTTGRSFEVVPHRPDVAAYPAEREHVFSVRPADQNYVVVRVSNYKKPRPPALPKYVAAAPQDAPPPTERSQWEVTLHFASGNAVIDHGARSRIDELLKSVGALLPKAEVLVRGHTDAVGSDASNDRLAARRASAVKEYLVSKGADPTRIQSTSEGEQSPIATNATAAGRAANRRAEVGIQTKE